MRMLESLWNPHPKTIHRKRKIVLLAVSLCISQVRADSSGNEGYGMLLLAGMGVLGITSATMYGGTYTILNSGSLAVQVVVSVLVAITSVGLTAFSCSIKIGCPIHKDWVTQLKADHETYLAGGEKTPYLKEVYRQLQLETDAYTRIDPITGKAGIDEVKLSLAIDQMVALASSQPTP